VRNVPLRGASFVAVVQPAHFGHGDDGAGGKLADAEVRFTAGELSGVRLPGFAVWRAKGHGGQNVTFSSRQFRVHGERRAFSMLRWIAKREAQQRLADVVWRAYRRQRQYSAQKRSR
jgi:hypothetical protein